MKTIKRLFVVVIATNLWSCSMRSVELQHAEDPGLTKTCRNAFFDWHAASHMVDYYNYHCAQRAISQGYVLNDPTMAAKDFSIPAAPDGANWNEALALEELDAGRLSEQKYGYIIGMLEMAYRATISQAKADFQAGKLSKDAFDNIKKEAYNAFYGAPSH